MTYTEKDIEKFRDALENTPLLFYGELEYHLDKYIKKFFSVKIKDVGFNDEHALNTVEFWLMVSILDRMYMINYGTSPRGAWLTDLGIKFKEYCLNTENPITNLLKQ